MKKILAVFLLLAINIMGEDRYPVVDTNQRRCFDNNQEISRPDIDDRFYGQDSHHKNNTPSYTDRKDGTIVDNVTGLIWQKSYEVLTYQEALETLEKLNNEEGTILWRLPSIKELYSLMDFGGVDAGGRDMINPRALPFIDTDYFDFDYGSNGDRIIDTQLLSSTLYTGKTMSDSDTVFGLNIADGRIKGYPLVMRREDKKYTVRFVSGNDSYGINEFIDNKDGTITDKATNLIWSKDDSKKGMNWEEALWWAAKMNEENYLGYNDWRVPDAKELHTIVDYSISPQTDSRAAIDEVFNVSSITREDGKSGYPSYWTSTTHKNLRGGGNAVYISFGEALGYMPDRSQQVGPSRGRNKREGPLKAIDVHGAGAQRSDPKAGNAEDYPSGRGPQGDVIRIDNYVRLVRTAN